MTFEDHPSDHSQDQGEEFAPVDVPTDELPRVIGWTAITPENKSHSHRPISAFHIRVAEQAHDYIDAHYMDAVHMQDLCRVTGTGVRTLQRCFRDYFQITVSRYLKTVRLEAARRALAASRPEETSVTTVAMQNGCTHLGRFSVEFRERYGISPRQLLASDPAKNEYSRL